MIENGINGSKGRPMFGLQVGLRQLFLAMLCVGVWFAHWTNQDGIARLEPKLANLRRLSPELIVSDPNKIAFVELTAPWFSIRRWEVFIPRETIQIYLATDEIDPTGFPAKFESFSLPKGQYEIQLDEQSDAGGERILVTQNGKNCFDLQVPVRKSKGGSSVESDASSESKHSEENVPVVLIRRRINVPVPGSPSSSQSPRGPAEGLLLWIK